MTMNIIIIVNVVVKLWSKTVVYARIYSPLDAKCQRRLNPNEFSYAVLSVAD